MDNSAVVWKRPHLSVCSQIKEVYQELPSALGKVCESVRVSMDETKATFTRDRICSDPFWISSLWYGSHETGSKLERYGSIWDHLHKWTKGRSNPYRIHQFLCKQEAYPYQFRTGSKGIRSLCKYCVRVA